MLTDTRQALLDAIRANPADDAPRLIYADWLDENSDEARAQFIRLQCDEARLSPWDARRHELKRAWRRLLREHARRWRTGLPRFVRGDYERGFLKSVYVTGAQFRRFMEDIWSVEPVAEVVFYGAVRDAVAALRLPVVAHLRGLGFEGLNGREEELLDVLTQSPHLGELRKLEMNLAPHEAYSATTLRAVQEWRLPQLQNLQCHYVPTAPDHHVESLQLALVGGKLLATVDDLMLLGNRTTAVAEAFANAPTRRVESLWLANHNDAVWLDVLTHTKRLAALRRLTIAGCDASLNALRDFFHSPLFGRLTELCCHHGQWTNRTVAELVQAPRVRQLRQLQLHGSEQITDASVTSLATAKELQANLRYLNLVWTGMTPEGVQKLRAALPHCHVAY